MLPPLVNAGMLMAYAAAYAKPSDQYPFFEMGIYALIFYLSHVITIVIVANLVQTKLKCNYGFANCWVACRRSSG